MPDSLNLMAGVSPTALNFQVPPGSRLLTLASVPPLRMIWSINDDVTAANNSERESALAKITRKVRSLGAFTREVAKIREEWGCDWVDGVPYLSWTPWFRGEPSAALNTPLMPRLFRSDLSQNTALSDDD